MHNSWNDFFTEDIKKELDSIWNKIDLIRSTPSKDKAMRLFDFDLNELKVLIIGMDPYPQQNRATGRAFEDGTITNWSQLKRNPSLSNILKLLHSNKFKSPIAPLHQVKNALANNNYIAPPNKLFDGWENQGVLLVNAALTCTIDKPGSHLSLWQEFIKKVLNYIDSYNTEAIWLVWGNDALALTKNRCKKMVSYHPRLHYKKAGSFLNENHFAKVNYINWSGT
ncbi:uracil-DNA glycosylase [Pokkaliibacter plantistimulans]|uniref:Uracil-DNA glycosylase n=1 Tax=Proteobacteria bacterium 228 TaxID=2083153 RepID=A0A2S5KQG6_9PROT|nr:uracil-DNA glycosylase [Pokkaliibacter plantistimulans]PPC76970.1 uracil-DNA glycosylase [Pokkaliibacter plantistimulans]